MPDFIARYHGTCEEGLDPILPGHEVVYNVRADLVHVECPDVKHPAILLPGEKVCGTCFLVHRGECW